MRIVIDNTTGTVLMWSEDGYPDAGVGQTRLDLDAEQIAAFHAANGRYGITFDGQTFRAMPAPPPPVPQTASAGDFVSALIDLGWYDAVDAAAKAAGGRALILWNRAATFERQHQIVRAIAAAIGKTEADLDTLFLKSATYGGTPENV
jgi:hypothetical protein